MKDESVHQIMDDIHSASVRLIGIVNDFLDASRLELKKIEFKIEQFDIVPILSKVVSDIKPTAVEKTIEWNLDLGSMHEYLVMGDKARAEQVLYNLMGNAMKFTKEGFVTIELKSVEGGAEIWVTDTGLGIPAENQHLLFRKFQQAGESVFTREASQGSGMGLYISKLLAEGMGGTIRLERSELGKGSTFVFRLPGNV
jgi:signal transduction histidine kinase